MPKFNLDLYPSQSEVRELFCYSPSSGFIYWRSSRNSKKAGEIAGRIDSNGYAKVYYRRCSLPVHRLIWLYMTGEMGSFEIDHINGIKSDNRWENLRAVTRSENMKNTSLRSDNKSGYPGVSWNTKDKRWIARICVGGARKSLGSFKSVEDAIAAKKVVEANYGYHKNHGRGK